MNILKALCCSLVVFLSSCGQADKPVQVVENTNNKVKGTFIRSEGRTISPSPATPLPYSKATIPSKWSSMDEINGVWTNLERDENGYLIYNPVNGSIPRIKVDNQLITVFWWLDGPNKFRITHSRMENKNKDLYLDAENEDGIQATFSAKIIDSSKKLVFWKWVINWSVSQGGTTEYKWVTTRHEFENSFRKLDYKNSTAMKYEKEFLPVEFD